MAGYLPTLYKARVPTKQPVCAICVERTRGKTQLVALGYRTEVWLCAGHASQAFQTQRSGRDFVLTLQQLWQAHGCLTTSRHKALSAHLARIGRRPARPRPGSYSWPDLRLRAEALYARGARAGELARAHADACTRCGAHRPALRTFQRWHAERRWLDAAPNAP